MSRSAKYLNDLGLGDIPLPFARGAIFHEKTPKLPEYPQITSADQLRDPAQVATDLRGVDWAFADDDTQFLTHDLHPYPAKFIPQIPGHCIARLSLPGELVLDPFGGSGTTALEAIRLGRRALSIDANPIGTLIGKVKTCNIDNLTSSELRSIRAALSSCIDSLPAPEILCNQNSRWIPPITNIDKWFPHTSRGELALIRSRIDSMESQNARNIAMLAVSKVVLSVSFQDSETRYSSRPRDIPQGETVKRFLAAVGEIVSNVMRTQASIRYGVCDFVTADTRVLSNEICKADSVDLIVTSPPYGNANDYHLYHRFRLLWSGQDPLALARVEVGSHLRHQRESNGFEAFIAEISQSLESMFRVLKYGRYAVMVIGDSLYESRVYDSGAAVARAADSIGFEVVCQIKRQVHATKRSFTSAGRRATSERLVLLRKAPRKSTVFLKKPPYKLWNYEEALRLREIQSILGPHGTAKTTEYCNLELDPFEMTKTRRLVFTHSVGYEIAETLPTWQAILENGFSIQASARKDPKYVTHGLHAYKGKFYPQLAKGLINLVNLSPGRKILDPFCGSGTTLLEGYLNGFRTFGCDMHPLAAKVARAKVGILEVDPDVVRDAVGTLVEKIENPPTSFPLDWDEFGPACFEEIAAWFPSIVAGKINWLLRAIRSVSAGVIRDFFEVVLSNILRQVSHQDPNDLRIRKRKKLIQDADVLALFLDSLEAQYRRIERFWAIRGYSPNGFEPCRVAEADSRDEQAFARLGLGHGEADLILTSPPYATALPYIDTDRLSLLVLFGMTSSARRPVEQDLIGSREIGSRAKNGYEDMLAQRSVGLPSGVSSYLRDLQGRLKKADVGFRRKNMPALLLRFFLDMNSVIANCAKVLRAGAEAMIVIGDNRIKIGSRDERIATTDFVEEIANANGLESLERIDISVTMENMVHIRNAITKNAVLRLRSKRRSNVAQA